MSRYPEWLEDERELMGGFPDAEVVEHVQSLEGKELEEWLDVHRSVVVRSLVVESYCAIYDQTSVPESLETKLRDTLAGIDSWTVVNLSREMSRLAGGQPPQEGSRARGRPSKWDIALSLLKPRDWAAVQDKTLQEAAGHLANQTMRRVYSENNTPEKDQMKPDSLRREFKKQLQKDRGSTPG